MNSRNISVYGVIPAVLGLGLIMMYFSGIAWSENMVAPAIEGMHPGSWREFGLLENLQNLFLLAIIAMALYTVRSKLYRLEKLVAATLAILACFILFEETDYGFHFYDYFLVGYQKHSAKHTNIHNIGAINDILKQLSFVFLYLFFFVAPLVLSKINRPLLRYILPSRWFVLTLAVMFILARLANYLDDTGINPQGNLHKNISEFEELTFYCLLMIYAYELAFKRV